ncbi:FAD-dependent oxidoreductase [Cyclobacterium jeungdonense]|uniref:FAD-dependent oxidoreductase n=1 Tax=Cyclobacterium jeungdonense TaxID=708087 RepID=A0ABT8C8Y9_9BACT|nr:FAD-dependent oxidoreductase [Cyclobacterium jeungdonense]MDN3688836.1 FAD-dependent oxidoreductase [Cyclobacterium jeungdonense]
MKPRVKVLSGKMVKCFLLAFFLFAACQKNEQFIQSDVCIYGNSSASILAAVQLKKRGREVVIVSPDKYVGGMTIEGLGGSDINNHAGFKNDSVIGGLTLEFYKEVAGHYGIANFDSARGDRQTWRFEPHVAKAIFDRWLEAYNIPVYMESGLRLDFDAVKKENKQIISFETVNGKTFRASLFIDASYEGDLLHYAGISTIVGREPNSLYGETKNGIRTTNTYRNFEVAVNPYVEPGNPESGLIHTIQDEILGEAGTGDHRIQAYCFRACLTKDPSNRVPFVKPGNYKRDWYEIYLRYLDAGGELYKPSYSIPNNKTDLGAWHDLSHNLYGMNHEYPEGGYQKRQEIYQYHLDFTRGLFWFLANDPEVPENVRQEWGQWGTTKDEFTDNEGWPRMLYIRDGRRMQSDYVITEHHTRNDTSIHIEDPVAIAFWPPDVHHVRRIVRDGKAYNEGFVFGGDNWKPFQIPYRSLVPRESECTNLLTPTCLSASHIAYGAIRLEWTFMLLGEAAGIAADLCLEKQCTVQNLPYTALKNRLVEKKQIIGIGLD